jgi:hypothetical protein
MLANDSFSALTEHEQAEHAAKEKEHVVLFGVGVRLGLVELKNADGTS